MQDIFLEKIVARRIRFVEYAFLVIVFIGGVTFAFFAGQFFAVGLLSALIPLIVLGVCYLLYRFGQSLYVEYEYTFTNGELDVDKIVARKRRKRVISLDVRGIEIMAPVRRVYADEFERRRPGATVYDFASGSRADGRYFAAFTKNGQRFLMIFEPGDAFLAAIGRLIRDKLKGQDDKLANP